MAGGHPQPPGHDNTDPDFGSPPGSAENHQDLVRPSHHAVREAPGDANASQVWTLMKLTVNHADVEVDDRHAKTPLLWVLRDVLGMHGTKFGCGVGYCAAC